MKHHLLSLAAVAAVLLALPARADVSVTNVTVRQHWPWNGLVDVDYEIVSDSAEATYWVYPEATDNRLGRRVIMNTLSGDGATNAVAAGAHRMVWDAKADNPGFHTTDLAVTMRAVADGARYLVVDLSGGKDAVTYPVRYSSAPPDLSDDTCRTTELWLRLILPGTFTMGSPSSSVGRESNETQHRVTLTKPYYIGVFEITQKQYELVTGNAVVQSDSGYGPDRARSNVSYDNIRGSSQGKNWPLSSAVDGTSFMGKLRVKTQLHWDLPTEAQWEYACRAGTTTDVNTGKNISGSSYDSAMNEAAIYYNNKSYNNPHRVGLKKPNAWGLYDMHGNVEEWCLDWYAPFATTTVTDPVGWANSSQGSRVYRGGYYGDYANECRASSRSSLSSNTSSSYYGFRAAVLPFDE